MTAYKKRDLASMVSEALNNMPVVVITGMRQSGKTTFLQNQPGLGQRRYLTFDDFPQLAAAKSDPDGFVSSEEPLAIDEAHKCPEIFTAIKRAVDKKRRPGHFLLSGSANFALLKKIRESLAGRALYLEMHPFSRREISGEISEKPFLERFFRKQEIPKGKRFQSIHAEDILNRRNAGGLPGGGQKPKSLVQGIRADLPGKGFEGDQSGREPDGFKGPSPSDGFEDRPAFKPQPARPRCKTERRHNLPVSLLAGDILYHYPTTPVFKEQGQQDHKNPQALPE